jgi:ABC-type polysaccharide/polyol phosphate export systems, permease component
VNHHDKAITKITPKGSVLDLGWGELWAHRELLYFLTKRDISVRYKQTAIGILWAVLQPLVATAIFTVIFSTVGRFETANVPYPLFALSGMMLWLFIHTAVSLASGSFTNNTNLVTKVYFPRLIVPVAATLSGFFDLIFSFLLTIVLMAYYGIIPGWQVIFAPVFLVLAIILAAAFGVAFSALNVRFRDIKFAVPFFLQIWMFASPLFYPIDILSERARLVFAMNPLVGILEGLRSSLFGLPFDWQLIGISSVSLAVILIVSVLIFKRMEDDFADLI